MKTTMVSQISAKFPNIKFDQNLNISSRVNAIKYHEIIVIAAR
jgi:hypothetical protein